MGAPWFQIQDLAHEHGIQAFSSNYALYADMSNRVTEVLAGFSLAMEIYSIDKSFLLLDGLPGKPSAIGRKIRERVARWVGLPVCVGIAQTKTLAKLANHCAKKSLAGQDGVCDFGELDPVAMDALFPRSGASAGASTPNLRSSGSTQCGSSVMRRRTGSVVSTRQTHLPPTS